MATVELTENELKILEKMLYVYENDQKYWGMLENSHLEREPYDILSIWGKVYNVLYREG